MKKVTRVFIYDSEGNDISDDIEFGKGKANPFGWSWTPLLYKEKNIGSIYCGYVRLEKGYTHKEVEEVEKENEEKI